jgi:hypothetical protein
MAGKSKKPELRKTQMLRIRMTEAEYAAIEQAAQGTGLELSTWARAQLLVLAKRSRPRKVDSKSP